MSNTTLYNTTPRLQEVWSLLWDRLGPNRLIFIFALLLSLGQTFIMMLFPLIMNIYYNQLELGEYGYIQLLIVVSTAVILILTSLYLLGEYLKQITMTKLNLDVTLELVDEAQRLPLERAQGSHSSDLIQRVTHDTKRTTGMLPLVMDNMGNQAVMFLLASIYMMWLNWKIALVVLMVSPLILLASHLLRHQLQRIGRDVSEQEAIVRQSQQDALQGMETIRAYGIGDWMTERFVQERSRLNLLYMRRMWWNQAVSAVSSSLTNLVVLGTILVVGWLAIEGMMALGSLMAFFILIWRVNSPLQSLASLWGQLQENLGGSVRTFALFRAEKEPRAEQTLMSEKSGDSRLSWHNVSFAYREHAALQDADAQLNGPEQLESYHGKELLKKFDLHVASGSFIAIVGPSGSGKSTVAKLAAGLLFPSDGEMCVYGLNPMDDAERARQMIAYVPQSPYFFSGTIRDNLLMVRPDAGEEAMLEAARIAQAHDFIKELPSGYDTELHERGDSLSGGQQQRLAIARALLVDRPIWILDEATSALDLDTERKVMKDLLQSAREQDYILLVITHRLTTVQDADYIVVMDKGCIKQQGNHEELLRDQEGLYRLLTG